MTTVHLSPGVGMGANRTRCCNLVVDTLPEGHSTTLYTENVTCELAQQRPPEPRGYLPVHLPDLVASIRYKPGWSFRLANEVDADGSGGLQLQISSLTDDSFNFGEHIRVRHAFLVPPASYNRETWVAWIFDRVRDVETHEAGEFFRVDGVREFAPHHGNGEDPYRVWHVSDWATAAKSAGDS